jgi:hypothetical protein
LYFKFCDSEGAIPYLKSQSWIPKGNPGVLKLQCHESILAKVQNLPPYLSVSDSVDRMETQESAFETSAQVILRLLFGTTL